MIIGTAHKKGTYSLGAGSNDNDILFGTAILCRNSERHRKGKVNKRSTCWNNRSTSNADIWNQMGKGGVWWQLHPNGICAYMDGYLSGVKIQMTGGLYHKGNNFLI